jgi:hypothetical protein
MIDSACKRLFLAWLGRLEMGTLHYPYRQGAGYLAQVFPHV